MKRAASFYRTAVGKKAVMAVTGIVFWGYVLLHMLGNLKILTGGEALNHYAEWLREMAAPAVPHSGVLWLVRIVLLTALVLHVHATYTLTLMNRRARPVGYRRRHVVQAGWAERTMRWSGVAILLFVIYHILHLTTGTAHQDFVAGDVFHNMTAAFSKRYFGRVANATRLIANLAPAQIAIRFGCTGVNYTPTSACASGGHAVGEAYRQVRFGYQEGMTKQPGDFRDEALQVRRGHIDREADHRHDDEDEEREDQ